MIGANAVCASRFEMNSTPAETTRLTLPALVTLVRDALVACGTAEPAASAVATALAAAEADGLMNHGIARAPSFCDSVRAGKIDGIAVPVVTQRRPGIIEVDANNGFAHPAIEAGTDALLEAAKSQGVAAMHIRRAYSAHVVGYHVERLARGGVLALGFANSPASMAPPGGKRGVLGTNPIAFAVPLADGSVMVVDQASSVIAKSEIVDRNAANEPLQPGWALDAEGQPTLSAADALKGTLLPSGGYKGFNIAMLVELMAAAFANSALGVEAPPFADMKSGPMNLGQTFIAFDFGADAAGKANGLVDALRAAGGRVPGSRRVAARAAAEEAGIVLPTALYRQMLSYTAPTGA